MMMITTVLLVLVLNFGDILQYSDPSVIFVFFFVFTISTIMFCFLISVFFSRANVAAACGGLIYLTSYLPYVILTIFEENVNTSHLIASVSKSVGNLTVIYRCIKGLSLGIKVNPNSHVRKSVS